MSLLIYYYDDKNDLFKAITKWILPYQRKNGSQGIEIKQTKQANSEQGNKDKESNTSGNEGFAFTGF